MSHTTTVGGIKLSKTQYKLVQELRQHGLAPVTSDLKLRRNPYSGVQHLLGPLAASLYDWIVSPERGDNINAGRETKALWDQARMLFRELWIEQYWDLLD